MKKVIALFFALLILLLSLCACSSKESNVQEGMDPVEEIPEEKMISKEELLQKAEEVNVKQIRMETGSNIVKAKSLFCDKTLIITGAVTDIQDGSICLYDHETGISSVRIKVALPNEVIMNLKAAQIIRVVGNTNAEVETFTKDEIEYTNYHMDNAYLLDDTFEVNAELSSYTDAYYAPAYYIYVNGATKSDIAMFDETVAINNYSKGDKFILSAKILISMDGYIFEDAVIVE